MPLLPSIGLPGTLRPGRGRIPLEAIVLTGVGLAGMAAALAWTFLAPAFPALARATSPREVGLVVGMSATLLLALRWLRPGRLVQRVEPATAEALGAMRAWIAAILLGSALWEDLASTAYLPRGMLHDPQRVIALLLEIPGAPAFFASYGAMATAEWTIVALLAAAVLGIATRWTVPLAAIGYLLMAATLRSYAWSYHTGVIPLYALLALSFTRCGDALSVDRWLRRRRGLPVAPAGAGTVEHGIGRLLVWMAIAVPYVFAGLSKVRNTGTAWWASDHMKQMVIATIAEPMHFDFTLSYRLLAAPDVFWSGLAFAAVAGEVAFGLVLVSRLARLFLPLLMAAMHGGILLMQNILFPDLIAIQAVFFDWRPAARAIATVAGRAPAATGDRPGAAAVARAGSGAPPRVAVAPAALALLLGVVWLTRTETFPLTAMQMFSRPVELGPVVHVRAWSCLENGRVEPARFERWIGAVADSRYRWLLRSWDRRPERVGLLHEFLAAAGARANAGARPGEEVRGFLVERRSWDFRKHPADPVRGELLEVVRHDLPRRGGCSGVRGGG